MPSFHEWLLARGALPIQGRINPFPTALPVNPFTD
jgi:hypothetical protein